MYLEFKICLHAFILLQVHKTNEKFSHEINTIFHINNHSLHVRVFSFISHFFYVDIDPSRHPLPIPPPLQHPLAPGNDAFHNFFQQAAMAPHPHNPPPIPLTVRSGVYDLRAVEERIPNH
jgi:hypothetical protein